MNTKDDNLFSVSGMMDDPLSPIQPYHDFYSEAEKFCTPDSLDASANYINILLTSYGYPVPLTFNSTDLDDQCKIVNCIYTLLDDRKKDAKEREEHRNAIQQLQKQQQNTESLLESTKRELQLEKKKSAEAKSKLEAKESAHKKELTQNTRLKEEISKSKSNMQYIKAQYAHETKRHEQDLAKVQDRLVKIMNDHYKVNVATIDMNSYFTTTLNNEADHDQVVQIKTMYTELLLKSKEKAQEARKESEDLRTCLEKIYAGIRRLLEYQVTRTNPDKYEEIARFKLPMNFGGKDAIELVETLLIRLKDEWDHQVEQRLDQDVEKDLMEKAETIGNLQQTVEDLAKSLDKVVEEYEEKIKIYKRFETGGFFDTLYPTTESAYKSDSEDEVQDENKFKFQTLKKRAMRDQRVITERALALGKERDRLQAERWAFDSMKREIERQERLDHISTNSSPKISPQPPRKQVRPVADLDRARKRLKSFLGAPSAI